MNTINIKIYGVLTKSEWNKMGYPVVCVCVCIYIYIYIYIL